MSRTRAALIATAATGGLTLFSYLCICHPQVVGGIVAVGAFGAIWSWVYIAAREDGF